MPIFATKAVTWSRSHPALAFLVLVATGALLYWQVTPSPPAVRPMAAKAQPVPGLGLERPVLEKTLLDVQKENARLRGEQVELKRELRQTQQTQETAERERKASETAREQKFEELLKRAQETQARQATAAKSPPKPQPKAAPVVVAKQEPQSPAPAAPEHGAKIQILRSSKPASFQGQPPSATRAETAFLPAGSFAEARLVTGVMATSRAGGALPMLLTITKPFTAPFQLQGAGRNPLETALPLQGCFAMGRAVADLGSSRVIMQIDLLSCVMLDGATFERPIKAFATGIDGTLGIVGRVENHDSTVIAKAALTGFLAGASEALRAAKQATIIMPLGGTVTAQQGQYGESAGLAGLASTAAQLSQFYLSQASQLLPTLWAEAGSPARIVLQEGLELEGLPTTTTFSSRGN